MKLLLAAILVAFCVLLVDSALLEDSLEKQVDIFRSKIRTLHDLLAEECPGFGTYRREISTNDFTLELRVQRRLYNQLFEKFTECKKLKAASISTELSTTTKVKPTTTPATEHPTTTTKVKPTTTSTTEHPTTTTKVKPTTTATAEHPTTTTKVKPTTTSTTEHPTTTTKVKPTTTTTEHPTTTTKVKPTTTTTEHSTTTTKVKPTTTSTTEHPSTTTKVKPTTTATTEHPTTTTKVKPTTTPTTEHPTTTTKVKPTTTPTTEHPTTTTKVKPTTTTTTEHPTTTTKVKPTTTTAEHPITTTKVKPTTTTPQPIECQQATNYTQSWRRDYNGSDIRPGGPNSYYGSACDFHVSNPWFRFTGEAGNRMLGRCPKYKSCGTRTPHWTDAEMPKVVGVESTVDVYAVYGSNCKFVARQVKVMRCSRDTEHDFIYKQTTIWTDACYEAFCGMM